MNQLLAALGDDVKAAGRNWIARCPVHNDKDFAMSIREDSQGGVLAHCHACGANGLDLYRHLELDLDELFGKAKDSSYVSMELKNQFREDKFLIAIAAKAIKDKIKMSYQDKRVYKIAKARHEGMTNKWPELI